MARSEIPKNESASTKRKAQKIVRTMIERVYHSPLPECYDLGMTRRAAALRHFKRVDPDFFTATKAVHASLPEMIGAKRTRADLFRSLASTVVSQQLGTNAARSIFVRVTEACGGSVTPQSILRTSVRDLRNAGLSGAKTKTLYALATAVAEKKIDLLALTKIREHEASEKLQEIWGLGPWSAEMFLMFSLGREDVFSPGDLGLVRAIETIYKLPKNAPRKKVLAISEKWAPYRTFASLLLWRFRDT